MKKYSLNPLSLLFIFVTLAWGCSNGISSKKVQEALTGFQTCSQNCDDMEAGCINNHLSCLNDAEMAQTNALERCFEIPIGSKGLCIRLADSMYAVSVHRCDSAFKVCMGEVKRCRVQCSIKLNENLSAK